MSDAMIAFAKEFLSRNIMLDDCNVKSPSVEEFAHMGQALQQAAIAPDTNDYDVLTNLAADLLRQNERMPDWLAVFAADVLEGKLKRPTKRGADKYSSRERDYKLFRATQEVAKRFSLQNYSNNELSTQTTAAEIVSEAAGCSTDVVITAYKKFNR